MSEDELIVFALVATAIGVYFLTQTSAPEYFPSTDGQDNTDTTDYTTAGEDLTSLDGIMAAAKNLVGAWRPPAKYVQAIAQAEQDNGIPTDMLARLLFQESRYREDIITGRVSSPVGAMGIAQFMPATAREMGIDPLDPYAAIAAAGRYLASLYRQTGSWAQALAAYNWGIGNVKRKGIAAAPTETRNYYSQILADVNASNGTTWA